MKKFLSLLLCLIQLGILPACAEISQQKSNAIETIHCNNSSEEKKCKVLDISKTEMPLESSLNKKYKAYIYTVKNNSLNNIVITNISNYVKPENAIKGIKRERNKLISGPLDIIAKDVYIPYSPGYIYEFFQVNDFNFKNISSFLLFNIPPSPLIIALSALSISTEAVIIIVNSPYYLVTIPSFNRQTKIAAKEAVKLLEEFPEQKIAYGKQIQFKALNWKDSLLKIKFKDPETNQEYSVSY